MIENIIKYIIEHYVDIVASLIGLLYLYLEYKASIWMWFASIVMAVFFIYIFYTSQLYASMTIYAYFLVASIYGWWTWIKNKARDTGEHIILRLPKSNILRIIIYIIVAFVFISVFLNYTTNSNGFVLLGDALATALNVIALWMVSRKWAEQWCLLIPANLISACLLFAQGEHASSIMFFIYFIVSIFGYFNWKRLADS